MKQIKKIPYGTVHYETLQKDNKFYVVDKTKYIEHIEELSSKFLFFLRPRRFGKSSWLSILDHYYDINKADQFEELFGDTYIGKNPTPSRNTYFILKFNFYGLPTYDSSERLKESFNFRVRGAIRSFFCFYSEKLDFASFEEHFSGLSNGTNILAKFVSLMRHYNIKIYLLIEEYDDFVNNILIHQGKECYQQVNHQADFLRSFFAAIKNGTERGVFDKMFVTGLLPLVLSDVTSGMNIGDNISNVTLFNSMFGFTQSEVDTMLDYYIETGIVKKEERSKIFELLRYNYNNYCFSSNTDEKVYNTTLILYFFHNYSVDKKIPSELFDENIRVRYSKLYDLIFEEQKLNGNFSILAKIIENGSIDTQLVRSFAFNDVLEGSKFTSLLYYYGLLTIKKHYLVSRYQFIIPNEIIKTMYVDYIRRALTEQFNFRIKTDILEKELRHMALKGEWQNLFTYIFEKFYAATSLRDFVLKEHSIKIFLLPYLSLSAFFLIESEPELNKGYIDLFFRKNYFITDLTNYEYLVELKYLKSEDLPKDKEKLNVLIQKTKQATTEQLLKYKQSLNITCKLIQLVIICSSKEVLLIEEVVE